MLLAGYRIKSGSEFQATGTATENARRPYVLSRKHAVRQVGDGWRNADAAACEHWRPGRSAPTDTVVRGRSDTRELDQFTTELDRDVNDDAAPTLVNWISSPLNWTET